MQLTAKGQTRPCSRQDASWRIRLVWSGMGL